MFSVLPFFFKGRRGPPFCFLLQNGLLAHFPRRLPGLFFKMAASFYIKTFFSSEKDHFSRMFLPLKKQQKKKQKKKEEKKAA